MLLGLLFAAFNPMDLIQYLHYLYPVLDIAAGIVCVSNTRLSGRLMVAGIGFFGMAGYFVLREVVYRMGMEFADELPMMFHILMTVIGQICVVLVIIGLAMAFADIGRQMQALRSRPIDEDDNDRPSWQRRGGRN